MNNKECKKCKETKELSEFIKDYKTINDIKKTYYRNTCLNCRKSTMKDYYSKNRDKILNASKEWKKNNKQPTGNPVGRPRKKIIN